MPSNFNILKEQFGEIKDKKSWLNSSLILNEEECFSLIKLTRSKNGKLVYRATRDGFTSQAFHFHCDGKKNTITIIKNHLNYVFGGYTSVEWRSSDSWITDSNAFIFSLRRNGVSSNRKFFIKENETAIRTRHHYGPTFGSYDIHICDQSNITFGSHTIFGKSYNLPEGFKFGEENTNNFLAGNYNKWLTIEIEVYHIQDLI